MILKFIKKEAVLCAAIVLAAVSCFFVAPDREYISYIDFRTLAILFSLMSVMNGLRGHGVFDSLGRWLIGRTKGLCGIVLILVLMCFFGSMLITNDVALITFVPLTFTVLALTGEKLKSALIVPVVCMQTLAANLGSMLTPIGNPQNLYLYGISGISFGAFISLMLPYALASLVLLIVWSVFLGRKHGSEKLPELDLKSKSDGASAGKYIIFYCALFVLSLLAVVRVVSYYIVFGITLIAVFFFDRSALKGVDYSLLITFAGFFVFIGNLGRIPEFSAWLGSILIGREVIVSVLASQVTSNVPAALLLSGFTDNVRSLIIGTNLGGLGTLIASMASLISFRQISVSEPGKKGRYFALFTASGIVFLGVLICVWLVIGR